jgi:integrase
MPRLTKRYVDSLQAEPKERIVFDQTLPGFGIRILTSGRKTFIVQYRSGGRTRRVKLGRFGTITADEARTRAREMLGAVAGGDNPSEDVRQARMAPTVSALCDRFMAEHVSQHCKPKTVQEYQRSIDKHIKPELGAFRLGDVTRPDVAQLHHRMRKTPFMANQIVRILSKMFNLAEIWGLRPDGSNPCRHIKKNAENPRERFLSATEISGLSTVLDEMEIENPGISSAANAIRLLMLTGCRMSEIQKLKWDYITPSYIVLPDSKTGKRKIPIDATVQAILDTIERLSDNPYVITGTVSGQHLTDLQRPWQRIRTRAGLEGVRIHDLRHTYASNAIAAGLPVEMIGKLLGHTQIATTMRYAHLADDPVREAAGLVARITGEAMQTAPMKPATINRSNNAANVIPLRKEAG